MLPELIYNTENKKTAPAVLRGLDYSDHYENGALADSMNLSTRRYPYIATKYPRYKTDIEGVTSILAYDGFYYIKNQGMYRINRDGYEENVIAEGTLSSGEKQMAAMYHKIVIFPDKIFLDTTDDTVVELGAKLEDLSAEVTVSDTEETGAHICTITISNLPSGKTVHDYFELYDIVTMSGWTVAQNNMSKQIRAFPSDNQIEVQDETMEADESSAVTIERVIPDLDYIVEHGNKLFGVSNAERTIYISAADDPRTFMADGDAGGYAISVATEGDFTGIASMSNSVVFFKEHSITKILGDYASEYTLQNYDLQGVKAGCHKSIRKINEVLLYLGPNGVYSYNGGNSYLISSIFGEKRLSAGVAGDDGANYYLSAMDGSTQIFLIYNLETGQWLKEDNLKAVDFTLDGDNLYVLDDSGDVWIENGRTEGAPEFSMTFRPFYETITGSYNRTQVVFGKKNYKKIILRTEMPKGAYLKIETRLDDGPWKEAGMVAGKGGLDRIPVPIGRCDKWELRLSGKGPFTLLNLEREWRIGSDR